ncbi:MerR family transcriptional regulator [Paenibacillus sp. DYY-L-2]|uniref:MerR family transcriptional regulator n=1 Tax=Paenibacillus sp. DYY-L-2 TaxID=3447013 RepID=UPI003F4FD61B
MRYTVKEVSSLAGVTPKTLHHYHKIGLLQPAEISESGYRMYGEGELERLQEILFYRELDFPLEQIKLLLEEDRNRLAILSGQKELLDAKRQRLDLILQTLEHSISSAKSGVAMSAPDLFRGFATEEEWREALQEQNRHLQKNYNVDLLETAELDVPPLNEQAAEAAAFMAEMADGLRKGLKVDDRTIRGLIRKHLEFMKKHGHPASAEDFVLQTRFFLEDDFHRSMLEGQQTGLAYYLNAAAESYAKAED